MLNPYIRSNLNVVTVFRICSLLLLKGIHEELLSLSDEWQNFNEFRRFFVELTASHFEGTKLVRGYQAISVDLASGVTDPDTKQWQFKCGTKRKRDVTDNTDGRSGRREIGEDEGDAPRKAKAVLCEEEGAW